MKYINLRGSAYVNGVLRHPHEGALHLTDEEAARVLKNELGDDVTADFEGLEQADEAPVEHITTEAAKPKAAAKKES